MKRPTCRRKPSTAGCGNRATSWSCACACARKSRQRPRRSTPIQKASAHPIRTSSQVPHRPRWACSRIRRRSTRCCRSTAQNCVAAVGAGILVCVDKATGKAVPDDIRKKLDATPGRVRASGRDAPGGESELRGVRGYRRGAARARARERRHRRRGAVAGGHTGEPRESSAISWSSAWTNLSHPSRRSR